MFDSPGGIIFGGNAEGRSKRGREGKVKRLFQALKGGVMKG